MSFAQRVRQELADVTVKNNCCRRSLAEGLLVAASFDVESKCVVVRYKQEATAHLAEEILSHQYGKRPDVRSFGQCGHSYWDFSLSSPACKKFIRTMDAEDATAESVLSFACDACGGAFLRGLFLACGTVNDPHKSFHMEFKLPEGRASLVSNFLSSLGYPPRSISRNGTTGLYYKDGATIEDLITLMGAGQGLFEVINSRIERDIRNNENRATNCVARNIEKTIAAATRQMEAINKLMESGRLESLPEGLQETARLRYTNPDASLDELVSMHLPIISRSGLNHRLKKIVDAADEL